MILIDSNVLVAYAVDSDIHHPRSVKLVKSIIEGQFGTILTSDYIFGETVTVAFIRSKSLDIAISAGEYIKGSTNMLKVDEDALDDAWKRFKEQKNTKFSFTDCLNVELMKRKGIDNIATFDKEFEKVDGIRVIS